MGKYLTGAESGEYDLSLMFNSTNAKYYDSVCICVSDFCFCMCLRLGSICLCCETVRYEFSGF